MFTPAHAGAPAGAATPRGRVRPRAAARARPAIAAALWLAAAAAAGLHPGRAEAVPRPASRLGGIRAQGPATPSITALHHNPAMLGAIRGTAFSVALTGTLEQQRIIRASIDPDTGAPGSTLAGRSGLLQPGYGWFLGGSLHFDPVTIAAGYYDVGSNVQLASAPALRYHLAPDPDRACLRIGLSHCPPNGGQVTTRQDATLAIAYDGGLFQLGAAVHLPRLRERFAFDNDTTLATNPDEAGSCTDKEDPACAERIGFKGWTQWIPRKGAPPGFDAALSFGVALQLAGDTVRLGGRYRTFPLRRLGAMALGGVSLVCRPNPDAQSTGVPACSTAEPIRATLTERLPQEVALGGSFALGPARDWQLDVGVYWLDLCQGGVRRDRCADDGEQTLRLVGLDRRAFVLPELTRHRGLQDVYGGDIYVTYRAHAQAKVLLATHANTAPVRRDATTAAMFDGARLGLSAGAEFRVRTRGRARTTLVLSPGYGLDLTVPRRVAAARAAYSPTAAADFAAAGQDINAAGADAVLQGLARPTNAGRYLGLLHTLSFAFSWGDGTGE
ncbi:MAG: hypothetical protein K1X88_19270 [Nannocystaceae bacterium]|nr:hypothetical protein [Nannocystaceae bacterium]